MSIIEVKDLCKYAKSLSYKIEDYDEIEVYGEEFKDADLYRFRLWVPIK